MSVSVSKQIMHNQPAVQPRSLSRGDTSPKTDRHDPLSTAAAAETWFHHGGLRGQRENAFDRLGRRHPSNCALACWQYRAVWQNCEGYGTDLQICSRR